MVEAERLCWRRRRRHLRSALGLITTSSLAITTSRITLSCLYASSTIPIPFIPLIIIIGQDAFLDGAAALLFSPIPPPSATDHSPLHHGIIVAISISMLSYPILLPPPLLLLSGHRFVLYLILNFRYFIFIIHLLIIETERNTLYFVTITELCAEWPCLILNNVSSKG